MNNLRRIEVLGYCKDWQNLFPDMSVKDCLFALYDDRMITGNELDYLMDWIIL